MVLGEHGKNIDTERPWPQDSAVVADRHSPKSRTRRGASVSNHLTAGVSDARYGAVPPPQSIASLLIHGG
jgi:hypothetical protein